MFKYASVLAMAIAASSLLATPAEAARHQFSCYDYAWESQDQKDCLANPDHMPMHKMPHKRMHHSMKDMKRMHDMKDMKGMHDKDKS
jgi:uncharacterized protein involved in copper resistance